MELKSGNRYLCRNGKTVRCACVYLMKDSARVHAVNEFKVYEVNVYTGKIKPSRDSEWDVICAYMEDPHQAAIDAREFFILDNNFEASLD